MTGALQLAFGQLYCLEVFLRIASAALLSALLGLERMRKLRGAGLRTFILISIGASVCVMAGELLAVRTVGTDASRIAASAVSGIGFIGAGTILVTQSRIIKGLTTAAGLWVSSCLGTACGAGFYIGAVILTGVTLFSVIVGEKLEKKLLQRSRRMKLSVLFSDENHVFGFFHELDRAGVTVESYEISAVLASGAIVTFLVMLKNRETARKDILSGLKTADGVVHIEDIST